MSMMGKRLLLTLVFVFSCTGYHTGHAAALEIFVSIPPQRWLADQIGGGLVKTHVLVDKGQDPHIFQPTPRQVATLAGTKLYFTMGMDFEKAISRKLAQSPSVRIVDTTRFIDKIAMTDDHHHDEKEDRHQAGLDPHVWLSPENLKSIAAVMARNMAEEDKKNKDAYDRNLQKLNTSLDALHKDIQQKLAPFHGESVYVFHPAFGYFTSSYHLHQQAVEIEGKSPTPKQLSSLISRAKADRVKVIFVQPQFDPGSADVIAKAIGGEVVALDPLAEDVEANLQFMADKIHSALESR